MPDAPSVKYRTRRIAAPCALKREAGMLPNPVESVCYCMAV
jgi:hypothetical protein